MKQSLNDLAKIVDAMMSDKRAEQSFRSIIRLLTDCLRQKHKILIAGNGGSASQAMHFAAELVGRFKKRKKRAGGDRTDGRQRVYHRLVK